MLGFGVATCNQRRRRTVPRERREFCTPTAAPEFCSKPGGVILLSVAFEPYNSCVLRD